MAKKTSTASVKNKSTKPTKKKNAVKRPNLNQIRAKIREICKVNDYNEAILLEFAEFVNGGAFKAAEPSMQELKNAVIKAFGHSSYTELKKNISFELFVQEHNLKMTSKEAWLKAYRKFVGLPESEQNFIGDTSINGVDVLRNFLPWKVFDLNPKEATEADIKAAFNQLAKQHHPDHGGNPAIFERLKSMRDSLLAAY
jgi:hypothetical protein